LSNLNYAEELIKRKNSLAQIKTIEIDQETANELLKVLNHQFIDYEKTKVHDLIKRMWEFVGMK
jgi:hypothetical protein